MENYILEMKNITVSFPGVKALDGAEFSLKKGEIHALLGENGAGKSTLMKVLTGVNHLDSGQILYDGKSYTGFHIEQAKELGISMIYQELNLVPELTVYENIFLGKELRKNGRIDKKKMIQTSADIIKTLGIKMDPLEKIKNLTMAYRQMVEIARSILNNPKILIMDEPNGPLTDNEVIILFDTMKRLKEKGVSIIYISHRLEEIFMVCDTCTVFRDGHFIQTMDVKDTDKNELVKLMVGRELNNQYPNRIPVPENAGNILEVKHLKAEKVHDISFSLRKGEILGIGGLVGSGRTETLRALFGADNHTGEIIKNGEKIKIQSPEDAINHGLVLVTEDRKGQGLLLNLSVSDNIVMPTLKKRKKGLFLDKKGIGTDVQSMISQLRIKTPSENQIVAFLSGGNQQKVIIGRWLIANSDIILFDEPTRGIDVGAKYEIYTLMNELKKAGKSVIMVSSDMPELMGMSDRIIVLAEGRLTGSLSDADHFSQEEIMASASDI